MRQGFVKVAAATPEIRVADVDYNVSEICRMIDTSIEEKAKVIVFPELCVTGYTCGDLFAQEVLLKQARKGLRQIAEYTTGKDSLIFVGVPLEIEGKLYNVVAVLNHGAILGLVSKSLLPNYGEFYEMRQFQPGPKSARYILFDGDQIPFGPQILFQATTMEHLVVAAEICEDLWSPMPPSIMEAIGGATLLVNCSASNETVGKGKYREQLVAGQSARLKAGYIYANAGDGESTTDLVFDGHNIIAENGTILKSSKSFENGVIYTEIDVDRLVNERRKNTTFPTLEESELIRIPFYIEVEDIQLERTFSSAPFVPQIGKERADCCEEVLTIQAFGLKKRLEHTKAKSAILGISGGLDSTLALLVTTKAFDLLGLSREHIVAVTMPCFGTTDRTYQNACLLTKNLGVRLREVPIQDAVRGHFKDIQHSEEEYSVTYENAQARERTQVLMDIANQEDGLVIGTGDMSELALGWATYNGDHMSMYG
ncbi:MAG: NAD(+) synthase, partial [Lachnospiraceae bacterium]